jgi:type VI secretion system secreted protein Hcp
MAVPDVYLKIEGIDGEAQDDKHKDWIEVSSFSWGASNTGTGAVGMGSGASKANMHDLQVTKYIDKATPGLMQACCNGKHFATAKLYIRKAGENPVEYLKYDMDEVFISSVAHGGADGGGIATESVALNFAKIKLTYTVQNKDGTAGTEIPKWYHAKEHKWG